MARPSRNEVARAYAVLKVAKQNIIVKAAANKLKKYARRAATELLSASHATDKTLAQCVQEDKALHAAENAAWYAYLQKEREEEAQRQAVKDARRAARRAAKEGLAHTAL